MAAILAADIAGYSALMGADAEATVRDLKAHQAVILPMIGQHGGRIIDTAGDGILAEFASVVGAVKCALAIQKTMAERNAAIDPAKRMQFRIGINQGDVVVDSPRVRRRRQCGCAAGKYRRAQRCLHFGQGARRNRRQDRSPVASSKLALAT